MESIYVVEISRRIKRLRISPMREVNACTAVPGHKPLFLPGRTPNEAAEGMVRTSGVLLQQ